jgi:hypothetical protein
VGTRLELSEKDNHERSSDFIYKIGQRDSRQSAPFTNNVFAAPMNLSQSTQPMTQINLNLPTHDINSPAKSSSGLLSKLGSSNMSKDPEKVAEENFMQKYCLRSDHDKLK